MASGSRRLRALASSVLMLVVSAMALGAQATVTGRITSAERGTGIARARVIALGTTTSAITTEDGRFTLRNLPSGRVDIQALAVGHKPMKKTVTLNGGDSTSLNFELVESMVQLPDVVVSATGELARRVELGNAISTLGNVANNVETKPINNI